MREYQHLLSHDVPVIGLGATAFVEQLAPILGALRAVRVADAGEVAPA